MFQFLIGRLETCKLPFQRMYSVKFQFLIGRLETDVEQEIGYRIYEFQFLIGRLETENDFILLLFFYCFNSS